MSKVGLNSAAIFIHWSDLTVRLEETQWHSLSTVIKYKQWKKEKKRRGPVGQERWLLLPTAYHTKLSNLQDI